jgi:Protein of unknown function (DUF433)
MGAKTIDRGRGPEIEGTRITVYDVMDYLQEGWRYDQIAGLFRLPPDDPGSYPVYRVPLRGGHGRLSADPSTTQPGAVPT